MGTLLDLEIAPIYVPDEATTATGYQCSEGRVACQPDLLENIETVDLTICVSKLEECPITAISFEPKEGYLPAPHIGERNKEWFSEAEWA